MASLLDIYAKERMLGSNLSQIWRKVNGKLAPAFMGSLDRGVVHNGRHPNGRHHVSKYKVYVHLYVSKVIILYHYNIIMILFS